MSKKRFFSCMGLLFITVAFCYYAKGENILKNPGFEDAVNNWELPGWLKEKKDLIVPELDKNIVAGPGMASLRFTGTADKHAVVYQPVKFPMDVKKYHLSAWMKTSGMQKGYAMVYIACDKTLAMLTTPPVYSGGKETEWKKYDASFEIPPSLIGRTAHVYVQMGDKSTGTAWFDDICLEPVGENTITLPGTALGTQKIKTGKTGVDILQSRNAQWKEIEWMTNLCPPAKDKISASEGNRLSFNMKPGQKIAMQNRIMAVYENCGGLFRLSADVLNENPSAGFSLVITATVYSPSEKKGTLASYSTKPANTQDAARQKIQCEFIAPPDTVEIRLDLNSEGKLSTPSLIQIENIKLERLVEKKDNISVWSIRNGGEQGMFLKSETPCAKIFFENAFDEEKELSIHFTVTDYFSRKVTDFTRNVKLPPLSITARQIEIPRIEKFGFYALTYSFPGALKNESGKFSFVIVDTPPVKPDHCFGISFFAGANCSAPAMRMLGVGSRGVIMQWSTIEKADGSYDWDWNETDATVKACVKAGIKVIGGFSNMSDRIPAKYKKLAQEREKKGEPRFDEAYYEAASKFEFEAIKRYQNSIHEWSAGNEINLTKDRHPWEYSHYIRRVQETSKALRKVDPGLILLGIGVSGADGRELPRFRITRDLWEKLHASLDGLGPDLYTSPSTYGPGYQPLNSEEGSFREMLQEAVSIVKSKGKKLVAVDEKGCNMVSSLPVDSPYAVAAANVQAREYVIVKSVPEVQYWLYFQWCRWKAGDRLDYGLWLDNNPRPVVAAYAAVSRILANAKFVKKIDIHKNIPCYLFERDGNYTAVLWSSPGDLTTLLISIPDDDKLLSRDVQGNPMVPFCRKTELKLTDAPLYLDFGKDWKKWEKVLTSADISLPEVKAAMTLDRMDQLKIVVCNLTNKALTLTPSIYGVKAEGALENLTLQAGKTQLLTIPLLPESLEELNHKTVKVDFMTEKGRRYSFEKQFRMNPVRKIKSVDDLKKLPPLILSEGQKYLSHIDFIANKLWTGPEDLSGEIRLGYDEKNFYLHVLVHDEFMNNDSQEALIWKGDSIQFAFETLRNAEIDQLSSGRKGFGKEDYLFTAAISSKKTAQLYCHKAGSKNLESMNDKLIETPQIKRDENQKTTEYLIVMPWKNLAPLSPEPERVFGFDCILLDSDLPGQAAPYWMQITPGIAGGQAPEKFESFVLMK